MRYAGLLYRALNPIHARRPLSGAGAARFGGRLNAVGTPALYTSLEPDTAIREANQVGTLQPTTLVAINAELDTIFDGCDETALAEYDLTASGLSDPDWRERMLRGETVPTQIFAARLVAEGYSSILVPSYAKGAPASARNLVVWRWNERGKTILSLIDDEHRLLRS